MIRIGILFLMTALFSLSTVIIAQAQTNANFPKTCPNVDSPNYNPNIALMVEDEELRLIDSATSTTLRVLDTRFLSFYPSRIRWLENCRYVMARDVWHPYETYTRRFMIIYDTFTGERIFHDFRQPWWFAILWSPSREQFLIKSNTGMYLMSESMPEPVRLFDRFRHGNAMRYYRWDMARNQLLVNFWENSGYLMIYDINTAAVIAAIANPEVCAATGLFYRESADGSYIIAYTIRGGRGPACVTVYNRTTNTVVAQVNAEEFTVEHRDQFTLSPDGRYLVIGRRALRVWDLWNLPEAFEDRLPIYRHEGPIAIIQSIAFLDNSILETDSAEGIQRWNIESGARIE